MIDKSIIISKTVTLIEALKKMDSLDRKLLIICEDGKFFGLISIGDIQRAIIQKISLDEPVIKHIRSDIMIASSKDSRSKTIELMKRERIECMPVLDDNSVLVDTIQWKDVFETNLKAKPVDCPVVIMAGGKGERLRPLTNFIPKPLIPVSKKTIIEEIIDRFKEAGCTDILISINYMGNIIKKFFEDHTIEGCKIAFIDEKEPLGTGGALSLAKGMLSSTFFVSNCDILVDIDLYDLYQYHKQHNNIATVVSVIKSENIPYGIVETKKQGIMTSIKEKPCLSYQVNSGLYILEPRILEYIMDGEAIDITELLINANESGEKIGVFPVSEGSWIDMGNWEEYLKMIKRNL